MPYLSFSILFSLFFLVSKVIVSIEDLSLYICICRVIFTMLHLHSFEFSTPNIFYKLIYNLLLRLLFFSSSTFLQKIKLIIVIYGVQFVAKISNIRIWKYIQTTIRFSYLEMAHSRIWKRQIFVFEMNVFSNLKKAHFSYLKKTHFSYLKMTHFSFLKMPDFRICNWHIFRIWNWHNFRICNWSIFRIWNCHIFRVWKRHISCFKTAHFVLDNKKAWWQSNMGNVNI